MTGYTKLFQTILTSSIWGEDDQTRIVWITMLALADQNGEVQASIPGLARQASVSVEAVEKALAKFSEPDKYSRTPDFEGRRIKQIEGGWLLLNHAKYRAARDQDRRREQVREAVRRYRSKTDGNQSGNQCNQGKPQKAQAEAEAEADEKTPCSPPSGDGGLEAMRLRVGGWFNRRPTTKWSDKEVKALKAVLAMKTPADDLNVLEAYYQSGYQYLRRDPLTLLNNWPGEIDRAKQWKVNPGLPMSAGKTLSEPRTFNDQMALFIRNQQLKANVKS